MKTLEVTLRASLESPRAAWLPTIISDAGEEAAQSFVEYFTAHIRNPNTRAAYGTAVSQFCHWAEVRNLSLDSLQPIAVATYIELLCTRRAPSTVKQHLAATRMLFDWMVTRQVMPTNPAASVRGPKYVLKKGKTPVLTPEEARVLLESIDVSNLVGLRDRALIGMMVYTFARVSAVSTMRVKDYFQQGKRWFVCLAEKGGKDHQVPVHHVLETYLDEYLEAASLSAFPDSPLFRSLTKDRRRLAEAGIDRIAIFRMVKRRATAAGLSATTRCHTFRATGITTFLKNGGTLERARAIAGHDSTRTTRLYDHSENGISPGEVELIVL